MNYDYKVTLDLNTNTAYTVIPAKQGDGYTRTLHVKLTADGEDYTGITADNIAYIRCRKPDGKAIINPALIQIENNETIIIVELTPQMLAVAGRAYADIVIYNADESTVLSSVSFILNIMSAPSVAIEAISSDEFLYLNQIVTSAEDIINEAKWWAIGPTIVEYEVTVSGEWAEGDIIRGLNKEFSLTAEQASSTNNVASTIQNQYSDSIDYVVTVNDSVVTFTEKAAGTGAPQLTCSSNQGTLFINSTEEEPTADNNSRYYAQQAENFYDSLKNISASATTLAAGASATASTVVDTSGHIQEFQFGIPVGPGLSVSNTVSVETLEPGQSATATITGTGTSSSPIAFNFAIPAGATGSAGGVTSVDGVTKESNGNVPLHAVQYAVQSLSSAEQLQARTNINALEAPAANPTQDYVISYDTNGIIWRAVNEVPVPAAASGYVLGATSTNSYDWRAINEVPAVSTNGYVLMTNESSAYEWGEIAAYSASEIEALFANS